MSQVEQVARQAEAAEEIHEEDHHPKPRQYVFIAVWLGLVTAVEVGISYVDAISRNFIFIPALLVLAVIKFAMVVLYFMHLKFDHRLFRRLFVTGIVLALIVFGIVLATFFGYDGSAAPSA